MRAGKQVADRVQGGGDDEIPEITPDLVPTCDQEAPVATYRDWRAEDTRVITVSLRRGSWTDPEPPRTREQARAEVEAKYGRILEANYLPGRAFFRVKR